MFRNCLSVRLPQCRGAFQTRVSASRLIRPVARGGTAGTVPMTTAVLPVRSFQKNARLLGLCRRPSGRATPAWTSVLGRLPGWQGHSAVRTAARHLPVRGSSTALVPGHPYFGSFLLGWQGQRHEVLLMRHDLGIMEGVFASRDRLVGTRVT